MSGVAEIIKTSKRLKTEEITYNLASYGAETTDTLISAK